MRFTLRSHGPLDRVLALVALEDAMARVQEPAVTGVPPEDAQAS